MKIAIAGTGYVGLSNAVLLAQHNEVVAVDIIPEKVNLINNQQSPIVDTEIEDFLVNKKLNLVATTDKQLAYENAEYVIMSVRRDIDYIYMSSDEYLIVYLIPARTLLGQRRFYEYLTNCR